jgi:hypothetical protein
MPFPEQHQYMTVIGDCYGSAERWQFGMRLTDGGVSNQVTAEAISDDVEAWWRGTTGYTSSNQFLPISTHRLTELKVARIQPDGTYPDTDPSYSHFYVPPIVGPAIPKDGTVPQNTIAVTLTTALPRGYASKGRIYLPPSQLYVVTTGTGLIPVTYADQIRDSIRILINAINANTVVGNVAIYSRGKGVPTFNSVKNRIEYTYPNPGASNVVTGVRVGRVVDTQRRRRRSLPETPESIAL